MRRVVRFRAIASPTDIEHIPWNVPAIRYQTVKTRGIVAAIAIAYFERDAAQRAMLVNLYIVLEQIKKYPAPLGAIFCITDETGQRVVPALLALTFSILFLAARRLL